MAMEAGQAPLILAALVVLMVINAAVALAGARAECDRERRLEEHVSGGRTRAEAALLTGREIYAQHEAARFASALVTVLLGWWLVPLVYRPLHALVVGLAPPLAPALAGILALLAVLLVHLVFAVYLPLRLAQRVEAAGPLRSLALAVHRVASPFLWLGQKSAALLGTLAGGRLPDGDRQEALPGPAGLIALTSRGQGSLGATQRDILRAYFEYKERPVSEVMIPLRDVAALSASLRIREARDAVRQFGFTRYPVYDSEPDHIIGVVHYRELVDAAEATPRAPVTDVMHSTVTLTARTPVSEALQAMQSKGCQLAVVADERGGTMGIVTIEDLLIELVLEDAGATPGDARPRTVQVGAGVYEIDGSLVVEEVEDLMDVDLEHAGFETIGAYVFDRLGRKPKVGDSIKAGGLVLDVIDVRGARIRRLRVQRARGAPPPRSGTVAGS